MQGAKKIPFAPDYSITKGGKVWSDKQNKWLKSHTNQGGYVIVGLRVNGKTKFYQVSRLVAFVWSNRADEINNRKLQVHHRNSNHKDNRFSNLVICTRKQHEAFHRIQREYMEHVVKTKKFKEFEKIRLQNYIANGTIE